MKRLVFLFFICFGIFTFSCKHELEKPKTYVNIFTPLAFSTLDIRDLLEDTTMQTNADSSISIVYKNELYKFSLDSLIEIPAKTFSKLMKLDSLRLSTKAVVHPVTLGEVAGNAGLVGQLIIASNGDSAVIPPIANMTANDVAINANEFFTTANLLEGFMDVTVENQWPIDIANLVYQLSNKSSGTIVGTDTFLYVSVSSIQTQTISLAGKLVEGDLLAKIINMDTPGSLGNNVYIDTSDALILTIGVRELKPYKATAVFPAQNIINSTDKVVYDLGGADLTSVIIESGFIKVECVSTIQDTLYFNYTIPSASYLGNVFTVNEKVLPAPPGDTSYFMKMYDFSGYTLDLTGPNKDTVNTFYSTIIGNIDSTGRIVTLSLEDSIYVYLGVINLIPEAMFGYFGQDTIKVGPDNENLEFFDKINDGTLNLEEVNLTFSVENSIGCDTRFIINSMQSINTKTNNTITLSGSILSSVFNIPRATQNPIVPSYSELLISNSNSNVNKLIENFPDKFGYEFTLQINPQGNISNYKDFVYSDKTLNASLNIEIPLSLITNSLTLEHITPLLIQNVKETNKIKDGTFTLLIDNGFPLDATLQVFILDGNQKKVDSLLISNNLAYAASLDNNLRVIQKNRTKLYIPLSESKMDLVLSSSQLLIKIAFTTIPNDKFLKIYSDYTIDIKLIGDFNYWTGSD